MLTPVSVQKDNHSGVWPSALALRKERNTETNTFTSSAITSASSLSLAFQNILHIWFKGECGASQSWSSDTNSSMRPTTCWCEDGGWRPRKSDLNRRTDAKFVLWVPLTSFNLFLHSSWPADRWLHRKSSLGTRTLLVSYFSVPFPACLTRSPALYLSLLIIHAPPTSVSTFLVRWCAWITIPSSCVPGSGAGDPETLFHTAICSSLRNSF